MEGSTEMENTYIGKSDAGCCLLGASDKETRVAQRILINEFVREHGFHANEMVLVWASDVEDFLGHEEFVVFLSWMGGRTGYASDEGMAFDPENLFAFMNRN